ncbi:hypothetical protein ASD78_16900 [Lysobacter sp. Root667]|uniref:hypothetical protein n=1 Tax=Lysobacter sp. Root667 TaxID=1736581 RepID=UPI0006FE6E24|nr:hypothetical protein [Lysobacter sp. Root667]KRA72039.1 hypothetical protein ASD78_16900 [Lysobacter sp. Root667]
MRIPLATLVTLDEDELSEALIWIDWRSFESEVVSGFSDELDEADAIGMLDEDDPRELVHRGQTYLIPLTESGRDRYVMIASIAEILKDRYTVFVHSDSYGGADTHGFLVLTNAEAAQARQHHSDWLERSFEPLPLAIDGFSGKAIPYFGFVPPPESNDAPADKKPFWKFW